jgi:hypothetical protein
LQNGKCYKVFSCLGAIFNIISQKAYNYLNIKERNLDIYFQIALTVSQRSLWTEFATMSFLSLPQSKGVFLRSARDLVVNGCIFMPAKKIANTYVYILYPPRSAVTALPIVICHRMIKKIACTCYWVSFSSIFFEIYGIERPHWLGLVQCNNYHKSDCHLSYTNLFILST